MTLAQQINPYAADTAFSDGRLREAQLKMLTMLEVIDSICLKHNLDYWLDAGTLLGAVRHQGFIPWDDDVDIAMPRASYENFYVLLLQKFQILCGSKQYTATLVILIWPPH